MSSEVSQDLEYSRLASLVARVLAIHDTTLGSPNQNYRIRFRGRLLKDSVEAYDELAATLRPIGFTPLFRQEGEDHVVLLVQGVNQPRASDVRVNLLLFVLTLLSVLYVGATMSPSLSEPASGASGLSFFETLVLIARNLPAGLPFAVSLLGILGVHEFGHYLAARRNRTAVSFPYFIPMPFTLFGTMGAFISMKEPPRNRRVLVDIAVAGPLAGLVVAIPVLLYGLSLSHIEPLPTSMAGSPGFMLEGNSLLYLASKFLVFGQLLPQPAHYTLPPLLYWARYMLLGTPIPLGGMDVMLHPVAWAGWAGLLVTGMNLIPAGQLDGGHLLYTLFGSRANRALPVILIGLGLLAIAWPGWLLLLFLILVFGRVHAEPLDQITQLDGRRKGLALLGLIVFVLVLTPIPLKVLGG
jgi:membrane-associated protease RseP (regulator of RpoE activity)